LSYTDIIIRLIKLTLRRVCLAADGSSHDELSKFTR